MKKIVLGIGICASLSVFQGVRAEGLAEQELQRTVETASRGKRAAKASPQSLASVLSIVHQLQQNPAAQAKSCTDTRWQAFAGRYAISFDQATNQPCRIYDLTFPTLSQFWSRSPVSKVPVQKFTAQDYLNWVRGDYASVYQQVSDRKAGFVASDVIPASWVSQLKFRSGFVPSTQGNKGAGQGLPVSFRASDLELGSFDLSSEQKDQLREAAQILGGSTNKGATSLQLLAENPKSVFEKFKFVWNDLEKVYDIVLEGEFLPLQGPVALIDYSNPYKQTVEAMVRTALLDQLKQLTPMIPSATVRALVSIALVDGIDFMNMMYQDRANQLEEAIRAAQSQQIHASLTSEHLEKALNILFGQGSSLVNEYLKAVSAGQTFDWNRLDKLGSITRYNVEKQREMRRNILTNNLVQNEGCGITVLHDSFVVCSKNGKPDSVRSIISQNSFLFWDLGALTVYNFNRPAEVALKRGTTWLLSAGLRMFQIPLIPAQITSTLIGALRDYSVAGMTNEGTLRGYLWTQKWLHGEAHLDGNLLQWLYLQNINPFLPKSLATENQMVQINAVRIGLSPEALNLTK